MLGVVNLDKPVGPTSHDMVTLVRRLSRTRRIGHAGTLDPLASGVLPILVGAATRFSDELTTSPKRYEAVIRLGATSVTDDAEGPIVPGRGPLPSPSEAEAALRGFVGTLEQRPPAYSARKLGGRIAHRAARSGTVLDLPPRTVSVLGLELLEVAVGDGWLDLRVDLRTGPGAYVRSLARDLGEQLGCGGYLASLRRTEAAGLSVDTARDPGRLEQLAAEGRFGEALLPLSELLPLPKLRLEPAVAARFRHGNPVPVTTAAGRHAVFDGENLIGTGEVRGELLHPEKVLAEAQSR
jgi:tRNA pseudouridine55 synthase